MYERAAARRLEAIESVLWDAERGAWFDYSLVTHSRHLDFYASNLAPLWAQCYSQSEMGEKAVQYLKVGGEILASAFSWRHQEGANCSLWWLLLKNRWFLLLQSPLMQGKQRFPDSATLHQQRAETSYAVSTNVSCPSEERRSSVPRWNPHVAEGVRAAVGLPQRLAASAAHAHRG